MVDDTIYRHNQTLPDKNYESFTQSILKLSHPFYKLSIHFINYASILEIMHPFIQAIHPFASMYLFIVIVMKILT